MKRRDFLKGAVVAGVSAPVVAKAVSEAASDDLKDDYYTYPQIQVLSGEILPRWADVELDGVHEDRIVQAIDEAGKCAFVYTGTSLSEDGFEWLSGRFRVTGMSAQQRRDWTTSRLKRT